MPRNKRIDQTADEAERLPLFAAEIRGEKSPNLQEQTAENVREVVGVEERRRESLQAAERGEISLADARDMIEIAGGAEPARKTETEQIRETQSLGVESAGKEEKSDATETGTRSIRPGEIRRVEGGVSASSGSGDHGDGAQGGGGGGGDVRADGGGRGRPLGGERADIERPEPADGARTEVRAEERPEYVDAADSSRTTTQPPSAARKLDNYEITNPDALVPSGKKAKLNANLAAVGLLKELQAEGRTPTREDQHILARFVGWGQFPALFNDINDAGEEFAEEREDLKRLLGERDYERAKASTINAHYTAPKIVQKMWDVARRLGFKGGRVLEPGMGVGYFYGLMPRDLMARSKLAGVELDPTSGAIARMLYPNASINVKGFQEVRIADGFYDLVITNVPFSENSPFDPEYRNLRAPLHDYYLIKSLDKVREGGLVIAITSFYTLDKAETRFRREMAARGDLVAAFRFPDTVFKANAGTEVVTDLLIFRKRMAGEKTMGESASSDYLPSMSQLQGEEWNQSASLWKSDTFMQRLEAEGRPIVNMAIGSGMDRIQYHCEWKGKEQPPDSDIRLLRRAGWRQESQNVWVTPLVKHGQSSDWTKLGELPDPDGGDPIPINNYYVRHPDHILGILDRKSKLYRSNEPHVSGTPDFDKRFERAISSLPENIVGESQTRTKEPEPETVADAALSNVVEGGYILRDGRILQRRGDSFVAADFTLDEEAKAKRLISVRDALNELNAAQLKGEDTAKPRHALNKAYDNFVLWHGPIRKATNAKILAKDPSSYLLLALETSYDTKRQKATKADIFFKDTIARVREAKDVSTPAAAIAVNLFESGRLDIERIAELLKTTPEEAGKRLVADGLAYENPHGAWERAEEYLSGNVRKKLVEARAAADVDDKFAPNVEALEKVQPADVPMDQISVKLGAGWIPAQDIKNFAGRLMQTEPSDFHIEYSATVGLWSVGWGSAGVSRSSLAREVYGTERADFIDVLDAALNDRPIRIYEKDPDGNSYVNKEASDAANEKVREVRDQFADWLWTDDERAARLHRYYNDNFNNMRVIEYSGAHYMNEEGKYILPGMNPGISLRPNQVKDIWQAVANGKLLDASEVGAGKAQPLDAKILTPHGWTPMGDLRVGDEVIAADGKPALVTGVFPQGVKPIYRVYFSDGSSTECCDEHLWFTQTYQERINNYRWPGKYPGKVRSLEEIRRTLIARPDTIRTKNHSIPLVAPIDFAPADVPLDPYLLGALLGDGYMRTHVSLSSCDEALIKTCQDLLPYGHTIVKTEGEGCDYKILGGGKGRSNDVTDALRSLGLYGKHAWEKRIPDAYKFNSIGVRVALLRGLMDTDGNVDRRGTSVYFHTTSLILAQDVVFLAQSLGGVARVTTKTPAYIHNGERRTGRLAYNVCLSLPPEINPFSLQRKAEKVKPKTKYLPSRLIARVEYVGEKPAQCIMIDHPSHLYVTDDCIVTHNTFILGAIAMEWRRLGIARKPAISVPKPRIAATVAELQLLYPAAKILSLENSFDKENRKRTTAMMATGDYDMIVLSHEQLDKMPMSPDVVREFIGAELEEIEERIKDAQAAAEESGDARAGNRIVKRLEKGKERVEATLQEALDGTNKDDVVYFEQTGIDALLVDEAHAFKSLPVYSRRSEVKGVPLTRSDRATSMYMRVRWLMRQNGNKGVVFATGTPITNTIAEIYNMQRYLQPEVLEERGIEKFDEWANQFADVTTDFEYTASGEYKPVSRMTEFVNLPELQQMIRQIMAVNFVDDMTWVVRPKKVERVITSPMTEDQVAYLQTIRRRVEALKHMSPRERKESGDNYLLISTDARKSSLSPRLVAPRATESGGKIEKVVQKVLEIHRARPEVTQMIFLDYGVNPNGWGYSVYDDIQNRLVAGGIPKERIANFGRMSDVARQKAAEKLNSGEYLIGIGSSGKMGTGINAQKRLAAMHHVDAPWLPAFVEQRNGRGHRQGNMNDPTKPPEEQTVEAYYYTTEGSFDVVMWQALTRKSNFIREFMRGDMSVREMRMDDTGDEETGEIGPEMILAATSGNPYELDRIKLIKDIERLERQERSHRQQQSRFRARIAEAGRKRAEIEREIALYKADAAQYEATKGQKFSVKINGRTYENRKAAGNQLSIAAVEAPPRRHTKVGEYRGFDLYVEKDKERPYMYLMRSGPRYHFSLDLDEPEGTFNSADANLRRAASSIAESEERLAALERDVETAKAEVDKPFKRAEELGEKRRALAEVQRKIEEMFDQKPGRDVRKLAGRLESLKPSVTFVGGAAYDIADIRASMSDVAPNKAVFDRWLLALQNSGIVRLYERDDVEGLGDPERYVRDPQTGRCYSELRMEQGWEPKAANVPPITALIEAEAALASQHTERATEDYTDRDGLEEAVMLEMAESASRAQRVYGDLYAEREARAEGDVLKKRSNDWQPKSISESSSFAEIAENTRFRTPKSPARANIIYGNEQAHFWVDRADKRLYNDPEGIYGLNLSPAQARRYAAEIRSEKRLWEEDKGRLLTRLRPRARAFYRRADAQIDALAKTFEDLADKYDCVIYVRADVPFREMRSTIYHELTHTAEGQFSDYMANWFSRAPHADRVADGLRRLGYGESEYVKESIAHLLSGQREELGLSLEQAVEFLDEYFANVSFRRGRGVMDVFKLSHTAPEMRQTLREAKEKYGPRRGFQVSSGRLSPALPGGEGVGGERSVREAEPGQAGLAGERQGRLSGVSPRTGGRSAGRSNGLFDRAAPSGITFFRIAGRCLAERLGASMPGGDGGVGDGAGLSVRIAPTKIEALIATLETIANIEAPDPNGKRSLKELSGAVVNIARSAIARAGGAEAIQDKGVGAALGKIASVGSADQQGRLLSWQDRIDMAVKIARETVEEIRSRTLARGAAENVAEITQAEAPAPRGHEIGW